MKQRSLSTKLRKAAETPGNVVVCSMAPHDGEPVKYSPRASSDPHPWVLVSQPDGYRYNGRECHVAVGPHPSPADTQ